MRVEPGNRGVAKPAHDDGRIEGGKFVEAHTEETLRPVPGVGTICAMSGPVRGTEVMKHTTRSARRWLSRETTSAGRRLSPERSVNGNRARTMLPKANT